MRSRIVLGLCISLLLGGSLSAANFRFTGAVDELWSKPGNWRENALPGPADRAEFVNGVSAVLDSDAGEVKQVSISAGTSHLTLVDGALVSTNDWTIVGNSAGAEDDRHSLEILGGTFNAGARVFVGFTGYGRLVIDQSGVMNLNAQNFGIGQDANGDGIVELRGGALNLNQFPLLIRAGANSSASMDFSGGVMKQAYSDENLAVVNGAIADGTITAYDGVGTVTVETTENNVLVVKGLHPVNPVPEDGDSIVPGDLTLSWTVDQGTPVDVWFGTDPELRGAELIVSKQAVASAAVTAGPKQSYYWAVDTYAPGAVDPNWGQVFSFTVDNQVPVVTVADDVTTWLDGVSREVAISAAVTDIDPTTVAWTVVSEPNEGTAVIASPAQAETTVTLSALGTYVLQLEADDGEYKGADTLTINVFSDHCEAAKSLPGWTALPGDINLDCVVDQLDMDILTENWLECNGLDCPDSNVP
jgi:hypothetical protein